jgi:hypothetical protein
MRGPASQENIMTISHIGSHADWWYSQNQAAQGQTGSSASGAAGSGSSVGTGGVSNPGTTAPASSFDSFLQACEAGLQSNLTQNGTATSTGSQTASADPATQAATSPQADGTRHHHHHHAGSASDDSGSNQGTDGLLGSIGQILQGGSMVAAGVAAGATQALATYGKFTPVGAALGAIG